MNFSQVHSSIIYIATYLAMQLLFLHRTGDKGELLVKTETMCKGYHNNEAQSANSFADGWYVSVYNYYVFVQLLKCNEMMQHHING